MNKNRNTSTKQVNVTLNGENKRMLEWMRSYEPEMNSDSKVVSYLMELGIQELKRKSAEEYVPEIPSLSTSELAERARQRNELLEAYAASKPEDFFEKK